MRKISALALLITVTLPYVLYGQGDLKRSDFRKADSVAALYPKHSLGDFKILAEKLTKPLTTEVEKFRAIYKWICNNIENDYMLYEENKGKREKLKNPEELAAWNKKFGARVFRKLLNEQKTVCSGYAYVVKELASYAGLSCVVIDGYGRTAQANIRGAGTANHSWNAVQLNGNWYLCDATWSSGAIDTDLKRFIKKYDDSYFLAAPALFVRNHYPLDSSWMLLDTRPTLDAFLNGPLIYSGAFRHNVSPVYPETFDVTVTKRSPVSFRFMHNENQIEKVELQIKRASTIRSVSPKVSWDTDGLYSIDHIFTTKGTHIVHILLNDGYVFTYTVKVL